ncbi:LpqB family beta-propeller domain-containing protein [Streptosporangium sp. NPDC051022]|uniref:LpqB family beta-propeller domain-containing protein n=1 Tax=Streptosporangium sp. NPDC051022 TaxID=3155752 RepID=UPI003444B84F
MAALACAVTACSVIPVGVRGVAVENGRKGNPLGDPYARVIAVPPSADWSAEKVVAGFRAAMASVDDPRREVARQYLTDAFAKTWDPQSGVTVYKQGEPPSVQEGPRDTRVTLKGTITALIDQDGRYRTSGGQLNEPFTLVKGPNGWRINAAPPGLLLSEADAERAYLKVDLYFLDTELKGLVVDQVRVPIDPTSNFAKTTVERLLKGPSSSLRDAVRSAFDGTRLIDVTTENNRVVVDLSNRVAPDLVEPMSAQLAGTLAGLTKGGWGFEVRVGGEPYYTDNPLTVDAQEQAAFDPWMAPGDIHPYYLADDALWLLGKENTGQPVLGGAGQKDGTRTDPAISAHAQVAALSERGRVVSVAPLATGGEWQRWFTGTSLSTPCWDRYQSLWTVDRIDDHTSKVIRLTEGGQRHPVSAPDLETVYVSSLKVARDGVHVAVAVKDGLGEQVKIGTIVRQGDTTRIANLQLVVPSDGKQTIRDIAWKDSKTLYVLTGKSGLLEASLIHEPTSLPSDSRIKSITALDGSLLAGAEEDGKRQILYWTSSKWEPRVKNENGSTDFADHGPSAPAYPLG